MKIYTRTGDDGTTGLIGGARVNKSDQRLECSGTIDELNASIGLAAVILDGPIGELVRQIQRDLFVIGSHIASPDPHSGQSSGLPALDEQLITRLEMQIDAADAELPQLRNFILPGGTEAAARLHLSRTVCRRAERLLVDFAMDRPVSPIILTYINRLSDWLFVYARLANHRAGVADVVWAPDKKA
jgi:cob(I)alamin adenosyltransferase